jgi:hypothetical protein
MAKLVLAGLAAGTAMIPFSAGLWSVLERLPTCSYVQGYLGNWHFVCG